MGLIKDRNSMGLTEAEDIKKRRQEYTEELTKQSFKTQITMTSSVHGIFQAIILEWVAISYSRGSS